MKQIQENLKYSYWDELKLKFIQCKYCKREIHYRFLKIHEKLCKLGKTR